MKVTIKLIKKPKIIPQCKTCQEYMHTQKYCNKIPECVKCAEEQFTEKCQKPKRKIPKSDN